MEVFSGKFVKWEKWNFVFYVFMGKRKKKLKEGICQMGMRERREGEGEGDLQIETPMQIKYKSK